MNDIVERLQNRHFCCCEDAADLEALTLAADTITTLRAEVERLREKAEDWETMRDERDMVICNYECMLTDHECAEHEIQRLRAGGCARDQTTTQYCAEAARLTADNERLRAVIQCALSQLGEGHRIAATDTLAMALAQEQTNDR